MWNCVPELGHWAASHLFQRILVHIQWSPVHDVHACTLDNFHRQLKYDVLEQSSVTGDSSATVLNETGCCLGWNLLVVAEFGPLLWDVRLRLLRVARSCLVQLEQLQHQKAASIELVGPCPVWQTITTTTTMSITTTMHPAPPLLLLLPLYPNPAVWYTFSL